MLDKPPYIANDVVKSSIWDEITASRDFKTLERPLLEAFCEQYSIVQRCIEDRSEANGIVAYTNDLSDIKELPQIKTLNAATDQLRKLAKALGIAEIEETTPAKKKETKLYVIQTNREKRRTKAAHSA